MTIATCTPYTYIVNVVAFFFRKSCMIIWIVLCVENRIFRAKPRCVFNVQWIPCMRLRKWELHIECVCASHNRSAVDQFSITYKSLSYRRLYDFMYASFFSLSARCADADPFFEKKKKYFSHYLFCLRAFLVAGFVVDVLLHNFGFPFAFYLL